MRLQRLFPILFAVVATLAAPAVPANAALNPCSSIIFNACFYSQPVFNGTEYRTTIYYPGCFTLPPSRSYHVAVARTLTVYSESNCTGQSTEIYGYFGFDIGFTARSYYYPPA